VSTPAIALAVRQPDGRETYIEHGDAVFEHGLPVTPDTSLNVGSVAKQITAYLTILAHRARAIDLTRNVRHYLPRLQVADITIADLITHSAGIRDAESLLSLCGFRELDHYTSGDLLDLAYRQKMRAALPGSFLYSNTHYLLLAKILETVHGTNLDDLARAQIFDPLSMRVARFVADPRDVIPTAAASYEMANGQLRRATRPVALPGPGSLWCSSRDLIRWLTHLHNTWVEIPGHDLPSVGEISYIASDHPEYSYGAGLYARALPLPVVFHYGHEHGFSAAVRLRHDGQAVVCLSNTAWVHADHLAVRLERGITAGVDPEQGAHALIKAAATMPESERSPGLERLDPHPCGERSELGTYTCAEVPGAVRLVKDAEGLSLVRRGVSDRLQGAEASRRKFHGPGFTLTLDPATEAAPYPGFVLDLDRCPGLAYALTKPRVHEKSDL
jgi:CubicO group peptidase (beta-lactamase class C family)